MEQCIHLYMLVQLFSQICETKNFGRRYSRSIYIYIYGRGILNSLKNSILPENELKILKNITLYMYTVLQPYDVNLTARTKYINALHIILLRRFIYYYHHHRLSVVLSYYIGRDKIRRHIHKCIIIIYNILRSNIEQDLTARYIIVRIRILNVHNNTWIYYYVLMHCVYSVRILY